MLVRELLLVVVACAIVGCPGSAPGPAPDNNDHSGSGNHRPQTSPTPTPGPGRELLMVTEQWPPFVADELPQQGFVAELARRAFARAGMNARLELLPWARCVAMAYEGDADVLLAAYYNDERAAKLHYSRPIARAHDVLMALDNRGITAWSTLEDLAPYRIGCVRGAAHSPAFDAADFLQKEPVTDVAQNIEKLVRGRVDLIAGPLEVTMFRLRQNHPEYVDRVVTLDPPLGQNNLHAAISRQRADGAALCDAFNNALQAMVDDGTYAGLLDEFHLQSAGIH